MAFVASQLYYAFVAQHQTLPLWRIIMLVLLLVDVRSFESGSMTEAMAMQELAMVHKAMALVRISMVSLTFKSGDNQCVVPFGLHFRCNRFGTI